MALTNGQKRALHAAARQAGVTEMERRFIQRNLGGFHSAADRTATRLGFIRVMAHYEDACSGRLRGCTPRYWRSQADAARPGDALRFACRRQAEALGWPAERLDAFLAGPHMSGGRAASVAAAGPYWLHRLLDALNAMLARRQTP